MTYCRKRVCFFTWDLQTSRGCASLSFATALSSQGDPFSAANPNADADTHGLLLSQVDETTLDICVDLGLSKHKTPRAADSPYKTAFCFKAADSLRLKHRSFTRGRASLWHRCQVEIRVTVFFGRVSIFPETRRKASSRSFEFLRGAFRSFCLRFVLGGLLGSSNVRRRAMRLKSDLKMDPKR